MDLELLFVDDRTLITESGRKVAIKFNNISKSSAKNKHGI